MSIYSLTYFSNKQEMRLNITQDEYDGLIQAREIDHSQFIIENKYQILLENYAELEEELLRFSLNLTLRTSDPWDTLRDAIPLFDRRVLNFLSSARMYIDQIPSDIGGASRNSEFVKERFLKSLSAQFDNSLAYRVCEALRNYTQHKDLPVHRVSHGWRHEQGNTKNVVINHSGLNLDIAKLKADGKFKASTLEELEKQGDKHDLKKYLREYMHSLGLVHIDLRKELDSEGEWAVGLIRQLIDRVKKIPTADPDTFIYLSVLGDNGAIEWKGTLSTNRYDKRKLLETETSRPPILMRVQLSSE